MSSRLAVILYHNVGPIEAEECRGLTVTPEMFARHLVALDAMGFKAISSSEWIDHVRHNREIPSRPVMITFDDAYASLAEHAFPALARHNFPAVVFVSTSLVGRTLGCKPEPSAHELAILSESQIAEWSARGIEFGAHAHRHIDLTSISLDEVEAEMDKSKVELSRIVRTVPRAMAYPYGRSNRGVEARAIARFDACFTIEEGLNDRSTPLHCLKRTMVQHRDGVADVCLRATFGKSPLERIKTAVKVALHDVTRTRDS
jgi:peptidoglycan/xylan/chitin deacetylase (PgdA/CDA1 family)